MTTWRWVAIFTVTALSGSAWAQNTSSVFGTVVDEGEQGWEYRASYDDDSNDINQRLHYQRAINGSLRWRLVGQVRETADSNFNEDYVRGELVWQVTPDQQDYQTGFRFELRHRFEDRPDEVTVHWINQWKHFEGWTLRALLGASGQFGDNDADGLLIESRLSAYTSFDNGPGLGLEAFSDYGSTSDWYRSMSSLTRSVLLRSGVSVTAGICSPASCSD